MVLHPKLGIMQGRLSPPVNNQIQAFPIDNWQYEFKKCNEMGLGCIEWIYEYSNEPVNPLFSDDGIIEIGELSNKWGVRISSVVADYFMDKRLFGVPEYEIEVNVEKLNFLICQCAAANIPIIDLPFVDSSALRTDEDKEEAVRNLVPLLILGEERGIKICLETSLPPVEFLELIRAFEPYKVYVNYDMGNSASLGYNPDDEIDRLGKYIKSVHIKDRVLNGDTVPLGKGNTGFDTVFLGLKECGYQGDFIFQAARRDLTNNKPKEDYVTTLNSYINFIIPYMQGFK
tara:strand:- start:122 stop:982 length:861 start_codon:yes stop_codon:yes gene_type:complete